MNTNDIMGEGQHHRSFWESIAKDGANRHAYIDWLLENRKEASAKNWREETDRTASARAKYLIDVSDKDLAENGDLYRRV